jgi:crotonobetainyl-CoA:carnitine CoA-transferase CaiB-like acyl-CoA transferase
MTTEPENQVFDGYRILDVGHILAGPMTSSILADFGADVIHIESPETGEFLREVINQAVHDRDARLLQTGGVGVASRGGELINRNKRNITLDMRKEKGRDLFHRLVAKSDVVTENFRPYVMDRWGNGWDILHRINPRLIYCRLSGFGQTGPDRHRRAYGMIGEAFSGWSYLNGYVDGPVIHTGMPLGDSVDSIWAATAIVAALYWRDARGGDEGMVIDQGLVEPLFRSMEQLIIGYDQTGIMPQRFGAHHEGTPYADICETQDGQYFSYSAFTYDAINRLLITLGLDADPRFNELNRCMQNRDAFWAAAANWFKERTLAAVVEEFQKTEATGAPVMNAESLYHDPHIRAREMVVGVPDPEGGEKPFEMQGIVPKLSESPGRMRNATGELGAQNEEVYRGVLGLTADELADLMAEGIV